MSNRVKSKVVSVVNLLLPVLFALMVGAICLLMIGKNPLQIYGYLFKSTLLDYSGLMNSLGYATPLIMTGIATALSYRANIYNMGIEGQMYIGSWFATFLGWTVKGVSMPVHIAICLLGGMIAGMAYAYIPAVMKAYLHINEVVTTIMLNNIAIIFTSYLTNGPFSDNVGYSATYAVADTAVIARINPRYRVTYGILLDVAIVFLVKFVLENTKFGYEVRAIGKQKEFADSVGMKVCKKTIYIFLIGGGIAGIAGATEIMGVNLRFTPSWSVNPGLGWDGQAVCLLANQNILGTLVAAILFGAFKYGGVVLQSRMGISLDIINIIKSCLILFLAARYISMETDWLNRIQKALNKPHARREEA